MIDRKPGSFVKTDKGTEDNVKDEAMAKRAGRVTTKRAGRKGPAGGSANAEK